MEEPKEEIKPEEVKEELKEEVKPEPVQPVVKPVVEEQKPVEEQQVVEEQKEVVPQVVEEQKPVEKQPVVEEPEMPSHESYPVPSTDIIEKEFLSEIRYNSENGKYNLIFSLIKYDVKDAKDAERKLQKLPRGREYNYRRSNLSEQFENYKRENSKSYSEFDQYRLDNLNEDQNAQLDQELEEAAKEYGITKEELTEVVKTIHYDIADKYKTQLDLNVQSHNYRYADYDNVLKKVGEAQLCGSMLKNPSIDDAETEIDSESADIYESYLEDQTMKDFLSNALGNRKINELSWKEYEKLEKDTLGILLGYDRENNKEELSTLSDVRVFLKYYSAKKDNLVKLEYNDENEVTGAALDDKADRIDENAKETVFAELETVVNRSELLKSYFDNAQPMGAQDVPVDNIKAFKNNEKTLLQKVENFYDNLSDEKKLALQNEAERITAGHAYLNSADVMKYFIHKQYDIIMQYRAAVDPEKKDSKFSDFYFAPCTMNALKRSIGEKYLNLELAKNKEEVKPLEIKEEVQPGEPQIVEQPQIIEQQQVVEQPQNIAQQQVIEQQQIHEEPKKEIKEEIHQQELHVNLHEEMKEVPQEEPKQEVNQNINPVRRIGEEQIAPFMDELARLNGRLDRTFSKKQKNSDSYDQLKEEIFKFAEGADGITVDGLYDSLNVLNEKAKAYMEDHVNDKPGFFKTCGKARQERIKTCARIKAMKALLDNGIAYDSKDGKKVMLACKLVCAEKLKDGFDGFRDLCRPGVIEAAMKAKLMDPSFNKIANKLVKTKEIYDQTIKLSGSNCLKAFDKMAQSMKAEKANKNQVKEEQREEKQSDFVNLM